MAQQPQEKSANERFRQSELPRMLARYIKKDLQKMHSAAVKVAERLPLEVFSGRVTSITDRHVSTTVTTHRNYTATVNTVPQVWVAGKNGQERSFVDATITACRPGHDVGIVVDRSKNSVLAMRNHSSGETWFTTKLSIQQMDGRYFIGMIAIAVLFLLLSWLPSVLLFGDGIGRRPWWAEFGATTIRIFAVLLGLWIFERVRRKHNFMAKELQDRINTVLESTNG